MSGNIYYNPEEFGLELIEDIGQPGMCYEFNDFVVWRRPADGALFYASDAGCSCPSPFEGYEKAEDLTQITRAGFESFVSDFNAWRQPYRDEKPFVSTVDAQALFDRIKAQLPEAT